MYQRLYIRRANRALNTSILYNRYRRKFYETNLYSEKLLSISMDFHTLYVNRWVHVEYQLPLSPTHHNSFGSPSAFVIMTILVLEYAHSFYLYLIAIHKLVSTETFPLIFFYVNVIIIVTLTPLYSTPLHSHILSRSLCTLNLSSNITCDTVQSNTIIVRDPN